MSPPDVSVIIPTYNRRAYLEQALQSCFAGHDALDVEVVVVDDGSTDGTRDFLRALSEDGGRVRPVFQNHQGAPAARNRGLEKARGAFVKFLDDDDWLVEGALTEEVACLRSTGADLSFGQVLCITPAGETWIDARPTPLRRVEDWLAAVIAETVSIHPTRFTYRRELLEGAHWRPGLPPRGDYDFALQVASRLPSYAIVDRVVYYYHQHSGGRLSKDAEPHQTLSIHLDILIYHLQVLKEQALLTPQRRQAIAQKIWLVGRMAAVFDEALLEKARTWAYVAFPRFRPTRNEALLMWADRFVDPFKLDRLFLPLRKAKRAFR